MHGCPAWLSVERVVHAQFLFVQLGWITAQGVIVCDHDELPVVC